MRSEIGKLASPKKPMPNVVVKTIVSALMKAAVAAKTGWQRAAKPQQHWKQERNRDDRPPKSARQKNQRIGGGDDPPFAWPRGPAVKPLNKT